VCAAAIERDLDVAGTAFVLGGEPYTPRKAQVLAAAEATGHTWYVATESGFMGISCAAPAEPGDVHVLQDAIALLRCERQLASGEHVGALYATTLKDTPPKLMLNVETGDHAVLEERACGCLFDELGLSSHLHTIRSYEKLTSEGMTLASSRLIELVEGLLPATFGGGPTDYQFVEHEQEDATSRLTLLVSPRVADVDDAAVIEAVLRFIASGNPGERVIADTWRAAGTLRVVREEPYTTGAGKVMALHVRRRS
jgi:hypothetical protein